MTGNAATKAQANELTNKHRSVQRNVPTDVSISCGANVPENDM